MKKIKLRYFAFVVILFIQSLSAVAQDEFDIIRKNIVAHQTDVVINNVLTIKNKQQPDGSWEDVNYADSSISIWNPIKHLDRIKVFCSALLSDRQQQKKQFSLETNIISGLRYWNKTSPKSKNWWHNEIAVAQSLGQIILMVDEVGFSFPATLKDSLVLAMKKGNPYRQTGANKIDIALHYLYRACATKDKKLMDSAVQQVFEPIGFGKAEGLQNDYSYMQHGKQLQLSSYGFVFLIGEYKVASWLLSTQFALSKEKTNLLQTYLTQTYLKTIRGRYIDFNVEGRGIARPDVLDKKYAKIEGYSENTGDLLLLAKRVHPPDSTILAQAMLRINGEKTAAYAIEPYHKQFYNADYTLHLRKEYSFNVRTVSNRTIRTETGNRENLFGKFLPDGSTNIQRTGAEYHNIMPVWEWNKIPGITSRNFTNDQPTIVQWGEQGSTEFVGGVSDGKYGCTVYDMNYNGVVAKKVWFFFDKEVVCLGTAINSAQKENITTTLNQCWLKGNASVHVNKRTRLVKSIDSITNPLWLWHDSVGYFFLQKNNVIISTKKQKGSWQKINNAYSSKEIEGSVFKAFINHGVKPISKSYAYAVVPAVALNEIKKYPIGNIEVLSNTDTIQAVSNKSLNMLQICFYQSGTFNNNEMKITVDKPCLVLVKYANTRNPEVWISDPAQQQNEINIYITNSANETVVKTISLTNSLNKGKSVLVE